MEGLESIAAYIPRHTRKLLKQIMATKTPRKAKTGVLDLSTTASLWGTVGSDENYNTRPDAKATQLREQLAMYTELSPNQICVGNDAVGLVDLILRTFATPNQDRVLCFGATNTAVKHWARMSALEVEELPLEVNLELPICKPDQYFSEQTKIMYIENPNQLIGKYFAQYDIVDWISKFDGIVIIDESSIDYARDKSLVELLGHFNNVIILQSFSKAWGLAGLPVGMAYGHPELIKVLELLKPPFAVNVMAQRMATKALYVADQKERIVQATIEERENVKQALMKLPVIKNVVDSESNTLLIQVENASMLIHYLRKEEYILVRDVSELVGMEQCLQITIGQPIDNVRLIKAFKDMPGKTSPGRVFIRNIARTLKQASSYLGVFKNILGGGV